MIAVLGWGPHGMEVARVVGSFTFYDDQIELRPISKVNQPWVAGAIWPRVRREITARTKVRPRNHGRVIFPGAHVSEAADLGWHVHVLFNAVVSHGCTLGDYVTVCSGAVLCGEVTVGDGVFIGANATIIHGGIRIGEGAVIGAGAVVTEDVEANAIVAGNPARVIGAEKPW